MLAVEGDAGGPDASRADGVTTRGGRLRSWWHHEVEAVRTGTGRGSRVVRWLAARPAVVLVPAAALGPGFFGAVIPGGDAGWFREAGLSMLGEGFFDVFSTPGLQIGALYLLFVGVLSAVVEAVGLPLLFTVAAVQSVGLTIYLLALARGWAAEFGASPNAVGWGVGVPVVFLGVLAESIGNGHPEELLIGLLLAHAVLAARQRRTVLLGLLMGFAVGLKLWGVLGAPVALLDRRLRPLVATGAVAVAVALLCYLPFHLFGDVNTFDFSWGGGPAPFGFRVSGNALGGWGFRVIQGVAAVLLGALVAWRRPGTGAGVLLTVITARIVLDPLLQMYYTIPFIVIALLWTWTAPARPGPVVRLATWPAVLAAMVLPYLVPTYPRMGVTHVVLIAATCLVVWRERSGAPVREAAPRGGEPVSRTR